MATHERVIHLSFAAAFLACTFFPALAPAFAADDVAPAPAQVTALFDEGKLLATGGVSAVEGEGGGLAPWALITGYGPAR